MSIDVARTADEAEALREAWAGLSFGGRDADPDLFLLLARTRPEIVRPHVVAARAADGRVTGMLVARLEEKRLAARFGYATVVAPRLRCLTVVCGGVAGPAEVQERLVDELYGALRRREADAVLFHWAIVGSPLHTAAVARAGRLRRQPFAAAEPHHVLDLPASGDNVLKALPKSVRDNLGRYSRRLEREFGARMEIRRYDAAEHVEDAIRDIEAVARTTYQRGLGAGFDARADADLVRLGMAAGWYRAWVLYLDGVPAAFELGMVHGDVFLLGAKGYDPEHSRLHLGKPVQLRVLEDLCADPQVGVYDFGYGDADYKRRVATRSWEDVDVLVYGRTRRALVAGAGRTLVGGADQLARRLAGQDRIARVKRRWRRLRTPAAATA